MKLSILIFLIAFIPVYSFSQNETEMDKEKKFLLNVGAAFPNSTHASLDGASTLFSIDGDNGSSTPFFMIQGIYKASERMSLGVFSGYFESDSEVLATGSTLISALQLAGVDIKLGDQFGKAHYKVFTLGGKLELDQIAFVNVKNLDTYASTYLGYNFVTNDDDQLNLFDENSSTVNLPILGQINLNSLLTEAISNANYPTLTYEANVGARYQISDAVAIFGEAGYGRFLINTGLSFSF